MTSLGWLFHIGVFLALSVYNLMVYAGRTEEKSNLYYACIGITSAFWLFAKTLLNIFTQSPLVLNPASYLAVASVAVTILLFTRYFFNLQKLKIRYIAVSWILLFAIPTTIAVIMLFMGMETMTANIFMAIPAMTFGIIFWVYPTYLIFSTGQHKEKWKLYTYISITVYTFCYLSYPLLVVLHIGRIMQVLTATTGALVMLLAIAYFLAKKSNQEHADLVRLKNNMEEKVKERTKRLEEAYRQKNHFFINLAHETKTPLTLITNYLDRHIARRGSSNELDIVKLNTDKLRRDMINFLDLEKLERGLLFYKHDQPANLSMILESKIGLFKSIAEGKNLTISGDIQRDLYIEIDAFALDRIINNLLDNAVKYSNENGAIQAVLKATSEKVILTMKNTGVPISKNQQTNIFKPFYQLSYAKSNIQGIGMGLNIVKNIMHEVNGTITVESSREEGTSFILTFHRYRPSGRESGQGRDTLSMPQTSTIRATLMPEEYQPERKNILLVEDNMEMLGYLQSALYDEYNIFLAKNGRQAMERIDEIAKPDVIVADIMMDEMNGYEFHDALMKHEKYSDIPFIFLTALSSHSDKIEGLKKGAVDYIYKPFVIEELAHKIHALLKLQENQRKRQLAKIGLEVSKLLSAEIKGDHKLTAFSSICNDYNVNNKEKQIIKLLLTGLEYKEIGRELDMTLNTVKKRIHTIYRKFGVQNKVELVNRFRM